MSPILALKKGDVSHIANLRYTAHSSFGLQHPLSCPARITSQRDKGKSRLLSKKNQVSKSTLAMPVMGCH